VKKQPFSTENRRFQRPFSVRPPEKGTGIPPSGKRPAPAEQIRAANQHIQPGLILRQSAADRFPVSEFVFDNRESVLDFASHFGLHIFDVFIQRGLRYVIKVFHRAA
jgi:hypothetical protein